MRIYLAILGAIFSNLTITDASIASRDARSPQFDSELLAERSTVVNARKNVQLGNKFMNIFTPQSKDTTAPRPFQEISRASGSKRSAESRRLFRYNGLDQCNGEFCSPKLDDPPDPEAPPVTEPDPPNPEPSDIPDEPDQPDEPPDAQPTPFKEYNPGTFEIPDDPEPPEQPQKMNQNNEPPESETPPKAEPDPPKEYNPGTFEIPD